MSSIENHNNPVEDENALLKPWLERLGGLVQQIELWAKELDWSTRRIEKKMEDSKVGLYKAPALVLQKDVTRILLEPIARTAPGAEGVVDLYLMPAYDDIASLYFYEGDWQLHYSMPGSSIVETIREAEHETLSIDSFEKVLGEMTQNAL